METNSVQVEIAPGETVEFHIEAVAGQGFEEVGLQEKLTSLSETFASLAPLASSLIAEISRASREPDEVELQFGARISAEGRLIIAKSDLGANFNVSLKWTRSE